MNSNLSIAVAAAVPLCIAEIRAGTRPLLTGIEAGSLAQLLGEHGDVLLYGSKKKGEAADIFNRLVHGIATLAFCPGGITTFGQHYEAQLDNPAAEPVD